MKTRIARWLLAPALFGLALLPACGGGGGGSSGGGTGGSGSALVSGTVDSFGSIRVNGLTLETPAGTPVKIDDNPKGLDDLQVGMVVRVEAELNDDRLTGRAEGIEAVHELKGPVTAVLDPSTGTIGVLQQVVRLTDTTVFADLPGGAGSLAVGDFVEVSGFRSADGSFRATRVQLKTSEQELEVKGAVANLDTTAKTFQLGTLAVNYGLAALDPSVAAAGGLANGLVVEVKSDQDLLAGVLVASFIKAESPELGHGIEVRAKGIITALTSTTDFQVDGRFVTTTAQTQFRRGTAANLAVGRVVEVEGQVNDQGVLVAREVSFELAKTVKLQGDVSAKTASSVTVLGVTVEVNAWTMLRDKRSGGARTFRLDDLAVGDRVDVRAFMDDDGTPVAARLEREDPRSDGRVILQGPSSGVEGDVVTVLGAHVDTSTVVDSRFENAVRENITRAAFLEAAGVPGTLVKFRGTQAAEGTTWERAELEAPKTFANDGSNEFEFELETETEIPG
jgi:hypothetical protein